MQKSERRGEFKVKNDSKILIISFIGVIACGLIFFSVPAGHREPIFVFSLLFINQVCGALFAVLFILKLIKK
jgi:hypothetical protein